MKENKISRRSFLKFGAAASAVGMMAAAPVAANAAQPDADAAADEENCLLGLFQKPKYIFLFIGDGMGTAQIQSARFYKGTVDNNGAVTEADLSFTSFPTVGSVTTYDSTSSARTPLPPQPPSPLATRPRAVSSICARGPAMCPMSHCRKAARPEGLQGGHHLLGQYRPRHSRRLLRSSEDPQRTTTRSA